MQSPNWEARQNLPVLLLGTGFLPGYPFDEGWPNVAPINPPAIFNVIIATGWRIQACLDFSQQYSAEGLRWMMVGSIWQAFRKEHVAAWKIVDS
jgi:hypothetical protein